MTPKERVRKAFNHEITDRPPFQATFTPEFADKLRLKFGLPTQFSEPHHREWYGYDLETLTGQDALQASVGWVTNYYLKNEPYTDDWGVKWRIDSYKTPYGTGNYTNIDVNPLKGNDELARNYQAPDPNRPELYRTLERLIREYGNNYWIIGRIHCTIFESAWALRGLDEMMTDFYINPEIANHLLDVTAGYHLEVAKNMAHLGADMLWLGDDFGSQSTLMIDPELWREYFKTRMKNIIQSAKNINPDIKIAYHSDGCNYDIVEDLIEIGVDVLNPIQTDCMDPEFIQEKYGDRLCFFGGISVQSTLPLGSAEDIKNEYRWLKNSLGKDGGWLCAPTHHVQLDTPLENFFSLLEFVKTEPF